MDLIECLFRSFDGAGSIYVTTTPTLTAEHLKRHIIRAIIHINGDKQSKPEGLNVPNLRHFSITVQNMQANLTSLFIDGSYFISHARKSTNILVWCPQSRQLGALFVFAHLILKYGYSIDYIWRLYDQRITKICLPESYIQKLRIIEKKSGMEDEAIKKLNETRLGKRMLRIGKGYQQISKNSSRFWASQKKSKRYESQQLNVEKTVQTFKKGESEVDKVQFQSDLSTRYRDRSLKGSQMKTHRSILKSFDYEN